MSTFAASGAARLGLFSFSSFVGTAKETLSGGESNYNSPSTSR